MSNIALRNFTGGEISPDLYARTDLVKYATGARTIRNFFVRRQGGLDNRPGTEYVGLSALATVARILPFVFNDTQTYVLYFTELQLRFVRDGAFLGAPYNIVTPYLGSELFGLQITQSADVVTIVHPAHPVYELTRLGDTNWTLTAVVFGPNIGIPGSVIRTPAFGGGPTSLWVVTAVNASGQESYASGTVTSSSLQPVQAFVISWAAVTGAVSYNIYRQDGGAGPYGFIFSVVNALSVGVTTLGMTPDFDIQPLVTRTVFNATDHYPAVVGQYQQRQLYGGANAEPETVYTSRTADRRNFTVSNPVQDDDAITFTIVGRKVSAIRHFVDDSYLILFTSGAEYVVDGDAGGVLRPTDCTVRQVSQHGASTLTPVVMGGRVVYAQARRSILRDLTRDQYGRVQGGDLTIFASHLFAGHTIVDLAYAETPNSIIWVVRDDGVLLGLTDVQDQEIVAWHHHDFSGGLVESVCVVPEGDEDRLYLVINRGGQRMLERMASRFVDDIQDAIFLDSSLAYDGRNTTNHTMTLSGSGWTFEDLLTCTASAATFTGGDVGNAVFLAGSDGTVIHLLITAYSSTTVVSGFPNKTVPASMQATPITTWARAVDQVSGLVHLEGMAVSVFADGFVVASPNNPNALTTCTVTAGVVTLDRPYARIRVGLPITADLLTLDLDSPSGPSMRDKKQIVTRLMMEVVASRGIFAGGAAPDTDSADGLFEFRLRDTEAWSEPVDLLTGVTQLNIDNSWGGNGRVFVRQVDPLPLSIGAVMPTGYLPAGSP